MSHYFIYDDKLQSNPKTFIKELFGIKLQFTTDNGVFSKDKIDYGSELLLSSITLPSANNILDIGCGIGTLGLFLAKKYPLSNVTMLDINKRAVELSALNIKNNKISNAKVIQSDGIASLDIKIVYDIIVLNPPIRAGKKVMFSLMEGASRLLNTALNGQLYIVNKKDQGALSTIKFLETLFENVKIINKSKGYFIIAASKTK